MKMCSHRRKELENLHVILPPTNTHYLWIISLAFIPLKNKLDLTNSVMFLMTWFFGYMAAVLGKKKKKAHTDHTDSVLVHCGWHRWPLLTEKGAVPPAGHLVLEKAGVCSWLCPHDTLVPALPALGVLSPCRVQGGWRCCLLLHQPSEQFKHPRGLSVP